ncbi:MAG: YceD family protein [Dehalococcoidia bacterium]
MEKIAGQLMSAPINVAQLLREPVGSSRSYNIDGLIDEEVKGPVKGTVKLIHTNRGVLAQAKLAADVRLICSRCLDSFWCHLAFTVEEEFLTTIDPSSGAPLCLADESDEFTIDDKNILDLSELIRQYTLLNLPMKPLCRPNCPGMKETNTYGAT